MQIDSPSKRDPGFSYGASPKTGLDTFRDDTSAGPAPPPRDKSKKKKKKGSGPNKLPSDVDWQFKGSRNGWERCVCALCVACGMCVDR